MATGQRNLQGLWLKALLFALFGYALLGKGFAYLFLGEMILIAGFFIFLRSERVMLIFSDNVLLLWAMFALWGFSRMVPFLQKYGLDAVRDAVVWGYGAVALLIVAFVNSSSQVSRALNAYKKFLRWYLPFLPILILLTSAFGRYMLVFPWAPDVTVIFLKAGDSAVHLAAAAIFLLIFQERRAPSEKQDLSIPILIGIAGWSVAAFIIVITSRGGMLALMLPIALVAVLEGRKIGWRVLAFGILATVLSGAALESNLITYTHHGRAFTADQVAGNIGSIFKAGNPAIEAEGTKEWRMIWWSNIVRYTVFGPYRWTGKGFGVNLALEDGPPGMTAEEAALRSPHNGTMTVLARMGIPGLALWVALNSVFVFRLFRAYRLAKRSGSWFWSRVNLWLLSYWLAAFIDMSFDVYLEGPQGGIWFWSIIGLGVAATRVQAYETRKLVTHSRLGDLAQLVLRDAPIQV